MYSKETDFLKLPQWEFNDHPDFLTDMNDAFRKIDTGVNTADAGGKENVKRIVNMEARVDLLSEKVQSIDYDVTDVSEKYDELDDKTNNSIAVLNNSITLANEKISELNEAITDEITARTSADNGLDAKITDLDNSVDTINEQISDIQDDISTLESSASNNNNRIDTIENELYDINNNTIPVLENRVTELETDNDKNNSNIMLFAADSDGISGASFFKIHIPRSLLTNTNILTISTISQFTVPGNAQWRNLTSYTIRFPAGYFKNIANGNIMTTDTRLHTTDTSIASTIPMESLFKTTLALSVDTSSNDDTFVIRVAITNSNSNIVNGIRLQDNTATIENTAKMEVYNE